MLNVVAVIFYPELSDAGVRNHLYWGLFLLLFVVHGPGTLSTDYLIRKNLMARI